MGKTQEEAECDSRHSGVDRGESRCAGEESVEGVGGAASRYEQNVVRENEREKAGQVVVSPRDLSRKSLDDTFLQRLSDSLKTDTGEGERVP